LTRLPEVHLMHVRDLAQEAIPVVIRATNVKFHVTGLVVICRQHNDVIERYAHGIMTFQGSPRETLEAVALDPQGSLAGYLR
jgi:hypothetical protein